MTDTDYVQVGPHVESAIRDWDQGGKATVLALLSANQGNSLLTTLPCHLALRTVLQSSTLSVEQVALLLQEAAEGNEELLETVLDVTETIEQELEDTKDLVREPGEGEAETAASPSKAIQVVKALLQSNVMPSHLPSLLLSLSHFPALGLTNPGQPILALQRLHTRRYTNAVIRQLKHNLLRESSEGFSALILVLTDHKAHGRSAAETWRKAENIIGYFNLAPARVLDVLLDVFAGAVEEEWSYWLDAIKCTPWGKEAAWNGGKGRGRVQAKEVAQLDTDKIEPFIQAEKGDRVLAEVLGFKFADYQREENEVPTPMGLIYVAALLIKEGFIKTMDLLPFLTPDDKQLAAIATKYIDDIRAQTGKGEVGGLANAAALTDEPDAPAGTPAAAAPKATTTAPAAATAAVDVHTKPKQIPEQRIQLLQAFLGLGYVAGAYFILASSPSLLQSHPTVSDHLLRLMTFAIEPVYQSAVRIAQDDDQWELTMPKRNYPKPRTTLTHSLPLPPSTRVEEFEYFYASWADDLQTWFSPDEMWMKGSKLFKLVGCMGSRDILLATKVCRIAVSCFARFRLEKEQALSLPPAERNAAVPEQLELPVPAFVARSLETEKQLAPTAKEMAPWLLLLRSFLLPSMTLSDSNSAYAREIWELLRYLPYSVRYSLYGEWRDVATSTTNARSTSAMTFPSFEAERLTKMAMRKLTTTDFKQPGRMLAKVAQSNPCAMWRMIMDQIKAYKVTGTIVPEAMRYMPQIAFDMMTFVVLDGMTGPTKADAKAETRMNHVKHISGFIGEACRRHPTIDMDPIIQFMINRMQSRLPDDLVILGTILTVMTGDAPLGNGSISDAQFAALAGGPELVHEFLYETRPAYSKPEPDLTLAVRDAGKHIKPPAPTKKSKQRLADALRSTALAVPVWIALAQARQGCLEQLAQMDDASAKAMARGFDEVHDIFLQYSAFLAEQLTGEEHIEIMPRLDELVHHYHLQEAVAFHMLRSKLTAEMKAAHKIDVEAQRKLIAEKAEAERAKGANGELASTESDAASAKRKRQWWPVALHEVMIESKAILPLDTFRSQTILPCPFYAFFWQMSLMDLEVSIASYDGAISRLRKTASDVKTWRPLVNSKFPRQSDFLKDAKRFEERADELQKEREVQMATVFGLYRKSLRQRSAKWFDGYGESMPDQRRLSRELYQRCFFPRAIMSSADAAYVAKLIARLHEYGCAGFSVLYAYDHFFSEQLAAAIYICTEDEARNLGRCLALILDELNKWHQDEKLFNEGALGIGKSKEKPTEASLPGFQLRKAVAGSDIVTHMTWSEFRRWMLKVHKNLAQAIVSCFKQGDYRHVLNGITVAQKVLEQFPLEEQNGKDVQQALSAYTGTRLQADGTLKIEDGNSIVREDLQNLANSYKSQLTQKRLRPWLAQVKFCPPLARARAANAALTVPSALATPATPVTPALPSAMDVDKKPDIDLTPVTNGNNGLPALPTGPTATRLTRAEPIRAPSSPAKDLPMSPAQVAALRARVTDSRKPAEASRAADISSRATLVAPLRRGLPSHIDTPVNGNARAANGVNGEPTQDAKLAQQRILDARARKFSSPVGGVSTPQSRSRDITPPAVRLPPREPSRRHRSTSVESRTSERSRTKDSRDDRVRIDRHRDDRHRDRRSEGSRRDEDRTSSKVEPSDGGRSKRSESGRDREREERRAREKDKDRDPEREARREARRSERRKDEEATRDKDKDKESRREHRSDRDHRSRRDDSDRSKRDDSSSKRDDSTSKRDDSNTKRDDSNSKRDDSSSKRDENVKRDEGKYNRRTDIPVAPRAAISQASASAPTPSSSPVVQAQAPPTAPAPSHGLPARPDSAGSRQAAQPMAPPPIPTQPARREPSVPRPAENAASPRPDKRPIEDVAAPAVPPEAKKVVKIDRNRGKRPGGPSSLMSAMAGAVRSVESRK